MTVAEFDAQRSALMCLNCRGMGLVLEHVINNNGQRAKCPKCGAYGARCYGPEFLPQGKNGKARKSVSAAELREVWKAAGDHCSHCGKSWDLCERLRIGRNRQHVHPIEFGGAEDGVVIPYCARCHEHANASLRETADFRRELAGLDEIIKRIETNNPELRS